MNIKIYIILKNIIKMILFLNYRNNIDKKRKKILSMKILIMCIAGGTTSLVADKIKEAARKKNIKDINIDAHAIHEGNALAPNYDFLLLGPHVGFKQQEFENQFPDKYIAVIPPIMFGRMDGNGILKIIQDTINSKNGYKN